MEKVALVKCTSYDAAQVKDSVVKAFDCLGGVKKFIRPGMKVLIKPNLVMPKKPGEAATTHPIVVQAICEQVISAGADVLIADSPGGFYNRGILKAVYSSCGYTKVAQRTGAKLNYDTSTYETTCDNGKILRRFTFIHPVREVDFIVNVPKLKTHGMMLYTGAVKNLFGLIPGALKAEYHFKMNKAEDFSDLLVDICECIKPQLSVMDAVEAMEGKGPTAGNPRQVGLILAGVNPHALDVVAAGLIGLEPEKVFTLASALERNLIGRLEEIEILGENFNESTVEDFKLPDAFRDIVFFKGKLFRFIYEYLKPRPVFLLDKCIGCMECVKHCPPKVICFENGKPVPDLKNCIRCFCCQELCPKKAVDIRRPWIIRKLTKYKKREG